MADDCARGASYNEFRQLLQMAFRDTRDFNSLQVAFWMEFSSQLFKQTAAKSSAIPLPPPLPSFEIKGSSLAGDWEKGITETGQPSPGIEIWSTHQKPIEAKLIVLPVGISGCFAYKCKRRRYPQLASSGGQAKF